MSKGYASQYTWTVWKTYSGFLAERVNPETKNHETKSLNSHCLACAKTELIGRTGGNVDIRGWQKQGMCGAFLKAMKEGNRDEIS